MKPCEHLDFSAEYTSIYLVTTTVENVCTALIGEDHRTIRQNKPLIKDMPATPDGSVS